MARWTFCFMLTAAAFVPAARADEPDVKIGMYQTMFRDVTPEMVAAIAKPLKGIMERTVGLKGDAELVPDAASLAKGISEKKFQIGVFHGYEYAWQKGTHPDLEPLLVAVPTSGKLQACVVVNANSKAEKVADLVNITVHVPKQIKAHCLVFLEDQKANLPPTTAVLSEKGLTVDTILDDLAVGKIDAALIDAGSLAAYVKNSPGNGKALKTIAQSDNFPFAVLAIHKSGLTQQVKDKIATSLTAAHTTPYGQPLMMLWGLKNFQEMPPDYDLQLAAVLKAYPIPKSKVAPGKLVGFDKK